MAAKKKPVAEPPKPVNTYGLKAVPGIDQQRYDRVAFTRRLPTSTGAPLRTTLFRNITDKLLPGHFEWHSYAEMMNEKLCECTYFGDGKSCNLVGFPGAAGTGKTYFVSSWAVAWWLMKPDESSVTLVSTSKGSLRKRGWAEVHRCFSKIPGPRFGNFVDSKMVWQCKRGDDKHAIIGKAVEEGSTQKVADDIKGVHTRRQMVIIDEATSVPAAIYEACANLYSYPDEFIMVLMGNPLNRLDQFGRFCEPEDGWSSVNEETQEWEGKPQESLGGSKPVIARLDAERSPNIIEGRLVSKHLPTRDGVERARAASGGGKSPLYFQNFRGFWPSEGLSKTIFSESVMRSKKTNENHQFTGRSFRIIGSFDHARDGGDRPCLRFAKLGEIAADTWGIEAMPPVIIPIDATSSNPIDFQLAEQIKRQCEGFDFKGTRYECSPEDFIVDATGAGAGFTDILQRIWSLRVNRAQWGSSASTDSVSLEDARPAKDVYANKKTEMWFRSASAVATGQLKGIDNETAGELVNMQFQDLKTDGSSMTRIRVMTKKEYKALYKTSPDLADSLVQLIEVARLRGFRLSPMGETVNISSDWEEEVKKSQNLFSEEDAYSPEEDYETADY